MCYLSQMPILIALLTLTVVHPAFAKPVPLSNKIAEEFSLDKGLRSPESASSIGYRAFDPKAVPLEDDMETGENAFLLKWKSRLAKEANEAKEADYLTDVKVLQGKIERSLEKVALDKKYGVIELYPATQIVFENLRSLINAQSDAERKKSAVVRFKAYVHGHEKYKPLLVAFRSRIAFLEKVYRKQRRFYAPRNEVEQYLKDSGDYLKGIQGLLEESGQKDWSEDFEKFSGQVREYDAFVKSEVLPKARHDYKLPREIYAYTLRAGGVSSSPEDLIAIGKNDYKKVYADYQKLAHSIGKKAGLKKLDPASVIAHLKAKPVTRLDEVRKIYTDADQYLEKISKENDLVSWPKTPLVIRFAGDAESKSNPVPHLNPPPLVNNRGERPEFVVPTSSNGKVPFDDFSYPAAALILTAHEGRPGHDLQFSSMLDNGVSLVRALFAFNNVNVEGWALYSEDLVFKFLPEEAQLAALQMRLWRIARMFLDPQIQLGLARPNDVLALYTKELGVSQAMAELEVRRYTYEAPGQATSYYFGLIKLRDAKASVQRKLGERFTEKCFNDAVLAMGLLPVELVAERLASSLNCGLN